MAEIQVGEKVPPFTLPDQDGKPFTLEAALAKGPLVMFFYPKDMTPGCTAEVCAFRDASGDFLQAGATVVGVSSDDAASHRRFIAKHGLEYPLLTDAGGALRKSLGVPRSLFGMLDGRVTYVIDREGVLRHRFQEMMRATQHVGEALATVKSLRASA